MRLTVATLNILGTADRWPERSVVLRDQFVELAPDVMAMQEVEYDAGQDQLIGDASTDPYAIYRAHEDEAGTGNSLLVRRSAFDGPLRDEGSRVDLGDGRSALVVDVPGSAGTLRLVSTHLHWVPDQPDVRWRQVNALLASLAECAPAVATIVCGDFNATPDEAASERMVTDGYRSAFLLANGTEPEWTYPTPVTPAETAVRPPSCIDYVWVAGAARVIGASTAFDRSTGGEVLYPSDHRGIAAGLEVG